MRPNAGVQYVGADGRLTVEGLAFFSALDRRLAALEARLSGPAVTGGAVQDAEARAAIDAMRGQA